MKIERIKLNNKKITPSKGVALLFYLIFSLSTLSVYPRSVSADENLISTPALVDSYSDFLSGKIRFTCNLPCVWGYSSNLAKLKNLYDFQQWKDLAQLLIKIGFPSDLSYFYLGKAAEALEHKDAALEYYNRAIDSNVKCNGVFNACNGINVPVEAKRRFDIVTQPRTSAINEARGNDKEICSTIDSGFAHCYDFPYEDGFITVRDVILLANATEARITGTVLNRTSKNLFGASFNVQLMDKRGEKIIDSIIFSDGTLRAGNKTPISQGLNGRAQIMLPASSTARDIDKINLTLNDVSPSYRYEFILEKPKPNADLKFSDDKIDIQLGVSSEGVFFELSNNTDDPAKIDWNNVAYVDPKKNSHKIIHKGIKYNEKENTQTPSILPPNARLQDLVQPTDYINLNDMTSGWRTTPLLPTGLNAKQIEGRQISLFLPIDFGGSVKYYNFVFKISNVHLWE